MSENLDASHDIALMEVGEDAPIQQQGQVGLNHRPCGWGTWTTLMNFTIA